LYGPHGPTLLSNGPSSVEIQGRWIKDAIKMANRQGLKYIHPTEEATKAWKKRIQELGDATLFPTTRSTYMGGTVPGKKVEMVCWLLQPRSNDLCTDFTIYRHVTLEVLERTLLKSAASCRASKASRLSRHKLVKRNNGNENITICELGSFKFNYVCMFKRLHNQQASFYLWKKFLLSQPFSEHFSIAS
jgi:hypothetical protein